MHRLRYALALWRTPGTGPKRFSAFLAEDPSLGSFFQKEHFSPRFWHFYASKEPDNRFSPDWIGVDRDLNWLSQPNHHCLMSDDPSYPLLLSHIVNKPGILFLKGALSAFERPLLGVVGTRRPTSMGRKLAFEFSSGLAELGWGVVSGLAIGIDTAAHSGAVSVKGSTIAVLGNGLDSVYPPSNRRLSESILENEGLLVSEFPIGVPPAPSHFPRRNRVISGLSRGILVVEAAQKSGSLITAQLAVEQGREVFAVPGQILSPVSEGCHTLIQQGAKLVMRVEDILEEFQAMVPVNHKGGVSLTQPEQKNRYVGEQGAVWQAVEQHCTPTDVIVERTGLCPGTVTRLLMELVLEGAIESVPGGYTRR